MEQFLNKQNMKMLLIPAGSFMAGGKTDGSQDALPRHLVHLSSFYLSEEPVTTEQFAAYEQAVFGHRTVRNAYRGYVTGISYEEATAYIRWLSVLEGKDYRLPTEAEWEYTARNSAEFLADRMCDPVFREWCYDWYAPYTDEEKTDPAGPKDGMFRCVRGGYLDSPVRYNCYPVTPFFRGALPPGYGHDPQDVNNDFGQHNIGFRVVLGKPAEPGKSQIPSMVFQGVRENKQIPITEGPPKDVPYFRKRFLLPVPPDNCGEKARILGGFPSMFRHHHHSPALTVAPNGDLICSVYSTFHEYDAESGLIGLRLRVGEDQWSFPDEFLNPIGVNDHAPLLYTSKAGRIYHFWGWPQLPHAYPFQYVTSDDNGASWSQVQFPFFKDKAEAVCRQPVNTCIESGDGVFYMVSDSDAKKMTDDTGVQHVGAASVLWRSRDGLKTWENPKTRTAGRHTTAVELKNGEILALGGKNTDLDGYMPGAVTKNGGDSYTVKRMPFPALNSGQRPSILRLQSGKLLVCGDYQTKKNWKPEAMKDKKGSYVAWSDDEGETWTFKELWGAQNRKLQPELFGGASTLGYSVMRQGPDGLIHLICSDVHPLLHLCFNEAWLLCEDAEEPKESALMESKATKLTGPRNEYEEYYSDGSLKCRYSGGIADDGRFLLDGRETFWYENGQVMMDGTYHLGKRNGICSFYDREGRLIRRFTCKEQDGNQKELLETFWPDRDEERLRTRTCYIDRKAEGEAFYFSKAGDLLMSGSFHDGRLQEGFEDLEP